jgi:hypothetical protein
MATIPENSDFYKMTRTALGEDGSPPRKALVVSALVVVTFYKPHPGRQTTIPPFKGKNIGSCGN